MSYNLSAYIASAELLKSIGVQFRKLPQGLAITTEDIQNCSYHSFKGPIACVTAEYFGGFGTQDATVWNQGERKVYTDDHPSGPINQALRDLGLVKQTGLDEFDTAELGTERDNEWL